MYSASGFLQKRFPNRLTAGAKSCFIVGFDVMKRALFEPEK